MNKVTSSGVDDSIGVGSDHRTAKATMLFDNTPSEKHRKKKHKTVATGWAPDFEVAYKLEVIIPR